MKRLLSVVFVALLLAAPSEGSWGLNPVHYWPDSVAVALTPRCAGVWFGARTIEPHSNHATSIVRGDSVVVLPVSAGVTVTFLFTVYDSTGYVIFEKELDVFNSFSTGVDDPGKSEIARGFFLAQNYPNPFNPETTIRYQLPVASHVWLSIYTLLGQEVRRLVDRSQDAAYHVVVWDGRDNAGNSLPSGVYFYRLESGSFQTMKKMVLMK